MTDKEISFEYYNPDLLEIIYLEANAYDVKVTKFKKLSDDTASVTVSGNNKSVRRLEEDLEEDSLDWSELHRDLDDAAYVKLAESELKKLGVKTA